jgi:hypothetical protein
LYSICFYALALSACLEVTLDPSDNWVIQLLAYLIIAIALFLVPVYAHTRLMLFFYRQPVTVTTDLSRATIKELQDSRAWDYQRRRDDAYRVLGETRGSTELERQQAFSVLQTTYTYQSLYKYVS